MNSPKIQKSPKNGMIPASNAVVGKGGSVQLKMERKDAAMQLKLVEKAQNSSQVGQLMQFQSKVLQRKANGLPENLRAGISQLSGYAMDDVKVHYNSSRPAQLHAHAYAQGTQIHLAPGQEKHLPHEAWHVVQQKQGRVKPTMQMKGGVKVNDNRGLEKEADQMGIRALQMKAKSGDAHAKGCSCATCSGSAVQRKEAEVVQEKSAEVVQLNCKHCGSADHNNKNCPIGPASGNPNHNAPVKKGKGERDMRKRQGHGMMSKDQAKRYVKGYKKK